MPRTQVDGCRLGGDAKLQVAPRDRLAESWRCEDGVTLDDSCPSTPGMLEVFKSWRQLTQFADEGDWVFASPVNQGRLPFSYPWVWQMFQKAGSRAGIGKLGTHSLRHSYRSWLDALGTPIAVQQKLMRHSDIRTTLNIYGDVVTEEMAQAHSKVVRLAIPKPL